MKQSLTFIFLALLVTMAKAQKPAQMTINQEAPVVQRKSITIHASPEKVWEVLTNIEAWSNWNNRIKNPSLQTPLEVGSIFKWTINGSKITSKVHSLNSHQLLGWTGKTFGATAIHNWVLEPHEEGTKVYVEESMEGWIISLIKKSMNKKLAEDMSYWLEQLKKESEQES